MNFTTKIHLEKYNHPIDYNSSIMLLGSCFAENMGEKFEYFKFRNVVNPFGIIFNAVSIEKLIHRVVNKIVFTEKDIFFHNDLWHCFEVHSQLSNPNKEEFLSNLNAILELMYQQITSLTHCIITLGTSWVYRNNNSNEIVANCHKVPQKEFTKELVSIEENVKCIQNIISLVHSLNPDCNFIFTVSPVRHIKDGFVENNVSKAHLISAIHTINHQPSTINYFPSYEIMMDELRDYRFYAEDMLHPSQTAIDYIWIKFFENYINQKEFVTMNQVCEIQRALKHRPFNPNSESHQKFLKNLNQKIFELKKNLPNIDFN
ncbi:GSCFA domain-containing protein [Flavobacterium sp.]|uniref:GSCFA domain-containing protein n=1 Tax=Flavobacterium sp. TaxID=239 RepID=UPI0035B2B35A